MLARPEVRRPLALVVSVLLAGLTAEAWPGARASPWVDDPQESLQYGVAQNGAGRVWREYGAVGDPSITIAVLDTGIDSGHLDLLANLWMNAPEAGGLAGVDDDRNGLIDDVIGYDFASGRPVPSDESGHGTHVAGIAAAVGGNGFGISGQCPSCTIMALKIRASENQEPEDAKAARAVDYAIRQGASVILIPWGTPAELPLFKMALKRASDAGRIIVAAAGNEGADLAFAPFFPAKYMLPGLVSVAAIYEAPSFPFWTNFGAPFVQLSSAGVEVYSTSPGGMFAYLNGTAMAAAQVAGGAALIKSYRPALKATEIVELMRKTIADSDSAVGTAFGGRPDLPKIFSGL
jgi:thermitase